MNTICPLFRYCLHVLASEGRNIWTTLRRTNRNLSTHIVKKYTNRAVFVTVFGLSHWRSILGRGTNCIFPHCNRRFELNFWCETTSLINILLVTSTLNKSVIMNLPEFKIWQLLRTVEESTAYVPNFCGSQTTIFMTDWPTSNKRAL